jgi:hypothetical protein
VRVVACARRPSLVQRGPLSATYIIEVRLHSGDSGQYRAGNWEGRAGRERPVLRFPLLAGQ